MTPSKAFWQAFPNPACFRPRISKQSFGGFVIFQQVTREKMQSVCLQSFSPRRPRRGHALGAIMSLSGALELRARRAVGQREAPGSRLAGEPIRRPSAGRKIRDGTMQDSFGIQKAGYQGFGLIETYIAKIRYISVLASKFPRTPTPRRTRSAGSALKTLKFESAGVRPWREAVGRSRRAPAAHDFPPAG